MDKDRSCNLHEITKSERKRRKTIYIYNIPKRDRIPLRVNGTFKDARSPTSAHLCKVEHHPAGAQLSHASTNPLSLFLPLPLCIVSSRSSSTLRLILPPSSSNHRLSPRSSSLRGMLWDPPPDPPLPSSNPRTADSRKGSATPKSLSLFLSLSFAFPSLPRYPPRCNDSSIYIRLTDVRILVSRHRHWLTLIKLPAENSFEGDYYRWMRWTVAGVARFSMERR